MFQMLTCLCCGWEWKSNIEAVRPQCSKCKSTKNIPSKDISPQLNFKKDLERLNTEITEMHNMFTRFVAAHEDEHQRLTAFELQATHDLKDLLFWNSVLKERTKPPKPLNPSQGMNSERELRPVRRITPIKKTLNISNMTARPAGY